MTPAAQFPSSLQIVSLPSPIGRDNRVVPHCSTMQFFVLIGVVIPLWLLLIAPLITFSQIFRIISNLVVGRPKEPPLDTGMVAKNVKPRNERKYDIVVLGVTGFTGRLAARHLAKAYGVNKKVKWAMAGRSKEKLEMARQSLADELELPEIKGVDLLICDTDDLSTVPTLVEDTRCVATTAGPFQVYGTPVVEACVKYGTHYVDITGEVGWVKCLILAFNDKAKETGAKIVPFCGHDSIPWDLTVYKLNKLLKEKYDDDLTTVKVWNEIVASVSGGTYQTATLGVKGLAMKAPKRSIDPFLQLHNGEKSTHTTKEDLPLFLDPFVEGRWTSPFVMAIVNAKIVRWTHALLQRGAPTLSYREVLLHTDFFTAFGHFVGPLIMGSFLLNPLTAWIAYKLFLPQPGQGPSMEDMEEKNYLLVTAEGIGVKGNRAESTFYVKHDPGYLETSRMLVESGLCLALEDESKLISHDKGGFYSPAAALGDSLLDRLISQGFEWNCCTVSKIEDEQKKKEIVAAKFKTS